MIPWAFRKVPKPPSVQEQTEQIVRMSDPALRHFVRHLRERGPTGVFGGDVTAWVPFAAAIAIGDAVAQLRKA